jgi:hypothetical protein
VVFVRVEIPGGLVFYLPPPDFPSLAMGFHRAMESPSLHLVIERSSPRNVAEVERDPRRRRSHSS